MRDLINHAASLLGFHVEYGRYRGVTNDIGYDGLWVWEGFTFVVEVKTTDAYSIRTAPLVGYVDKLISAGRIPDWDHALGPYVFGRTDSDLTQLANTIYAENRMRQLRIATIESILSLGKLVEERQISPQEAVTIFRPAGVFVSDTVQLLTRIGTRANTGLNKSDRLPVISGSAPNTVQTPRSNPASKPTVFKGSNANTDSDGRIHLLTPVADDDQTTAIETIQALLQSGWYVLGDHTPGLKELGPGSRICCYQSPPVGVVAWAPIDTFPKQEALPPAAAALVRHPDKYPWGFRVSNPVFFFEDPVVIDAELRARLEAFSGREPEQPWSWFVRGTRKVSEHDFCLLTRSRGAS